MAKKVSVFSGPLASADGALVGDIIIDKGIIFQMQEDGLKELSDIQSGWATVERETKKELKKEVDAEAKASSEAAAEAKKEAKAEKDAEKKAEHKK